MAMTNTYTGANGTLTLANEDTPEGQDASAVVNTYGITTVGRVTGVDICVQTDLEAFHEIGRRHPTSLHPGNIRISGSVDRAYINGALLELLLGRGAGPTQIAEPYVQPTFNMTIALNDPAVPGTSASLELKGVKFQNWAYKMPEDDFVMENATFQALTISVLDREAPEGGGEAVAQIPEGFGGEA
ncbi:hypothetical protein MNBD_CHLOROFLEXI01-3954 [hydrothermal vent metagenome]|uniref:Uncharacterized protein n=1 Tax=hydrothermal vent metagenome TaxID=652676 RepID=A0A3B0UGX3_9ZZZZ